MVSYQKTLLSGESDFPSSSMWNRRKPARSNIFKNELKIGGFKVVSPDYEFANQQAVSFNLFWSQEGKLLMCTDVRSVVHRHSAWQPWQGSLTLDRKA